MYIYIHVMNRYICMYAIYVYIICAYVQHISPRHMYLKRCRGVNVTNMCLIEAFDANKAG